MTNLQSILEFNLLMLTFLLFKISQWLCLLCIITIMGSTLWEIYRNRVLLSQLLHLEELLQSNLQVCHQSLLRSSTLLATMSWSKTGYLLTSPRTKALLGLNQLWKVNYRIKPAKGRYKRPNRWLSTFPNKKMKLWILKLVLLDWGETRFLNAKNHSLLNWSTK